MLRLASVNATQRSNTKVCAGLSIHDVKNSVGHAVAAARLLQKISDSENTGFQVCSHIAENGLAADDPRETRIASAQVVPC